MPQSSPRQCSLPCAHSKSAWPLTLASVGPFVPRPKKSDAAHVYMGICYHVGTSLRFVTGIHKQVSKYTDPKTKRPQRGVAHQEYNDVLRDHFVPAGNRLFQHAGHCADNWQMQQDNAGPDKTAGNMAYIADNVPGGHFLTWPANSPDLSPIENLWGWMDSKLHKLTAMHHLWPLLCVEARDMMPNC